MHITARLQGGAKLFTEPLRHSVAEYICDAAQMAGVRVLALVIMPNHFHVVAKVGRVPLGWMMQRAMQRTALLVRRHHGGEGHVFGRSYWSCFCSNARYVRQAIIYTHLNPWKAGLGEASDYEWTSHRALTGNPRAGWESKIDVAETLLLFQDVTVSPSDALENYNSFISESQYRYRNAVPGDKFLFDRVWTGNVLTAHIGDDHWLATYMPGPESIQMPRPDTRDAADALLKRIDPNCDLDTLRLGKGRALIPIRRALVANLKVRQHSGSAIARCLYVSRSYVSKIEPSFLDQADTQIGQR